MKQNKLKTLALVLALALVLTLAVCMLVACNPKDSNINDDISDDATELFSEEQFNAILGYLYSADYLGSGGEADTYIYHFSADEIKKYSGNETKNGAVTVLIAIPSYKSAMLVFFSSPAEATKEFEYIKGQNTDVFKNWFEDHEYFTSTVGNIVVAESEKGLFENHIAKATMPSNVSDVRKNMIKKAYNKILSASAAYALFRVQKWQNNTRHDQFRVLIKAESGNCDENFEYTDIIPDYIKHQWEKDSRFYTDDSYIDTTSEEGYVFSYYKYKPGFTYEEKGLDELRITGYYHTENLVENLTIPSKLDNKNVTSIEIYDPLLVKNITVEEGLTAVRLEKCSELENIKLPSTLKSLFLIAEQLNSLTLPNSMVDITFYSACLETITLPTTLHYADLKCPSLKTVNYDGSIADFEAKFGSRANGWCRIYVGEDETTHESIYKYITITVVCNDGSLTYPQNDTQD